MSEAAAPAGVHAAIEAGADAALDLIRDAIRIPGVSRTGSGLEEMARFTEAALSRLGARTRLSRGKVAPIVEGWLGEDPDKPTLLFYDLYDVQPAEGQGGWSVPPFAAEIRDGPDGRARLIGRGAFNSKGPLFGALGAIAAFQEAGADLPVNLRFLIEGEEEIGSPSLPAYIEEHKAELASCSAAYIPYLGTDVAGETVLRLGFKGLALLRFTVRGGDWGGPAERDIHAYHGALVDSPASHLVRALRMITDARGGLAVDGFPEPAPDEEDRRLLAAAAERFDPASYAAAHGVRTLAEAYRPLEERLGRLMFACTLNIDALAAGLIEADGAPATMIPREASAFADLRVVPGVAPDEAIELIRAHLDRRGYQHVEIETLSAYPASRARPGEPVVRALTAAMERHTERLTVWPIHAGAAPMHLFSDVIGIPYAFGGVGHGGGAHGPDEYLVIDDLKPFMRTVADFLRLFAAEARAAC